MNVAVLRPREVPSALEAEQAVLGAILINNESYQSIAGFLKPEHFGEGVHASIYEITAGLISAGERAMPLTVLPRLPSGLRVGDLNASTYLAHLCAGATTISGLPSVGRAVFEAWARRSLAGLAGDLTVTDDNIRDLIAYAESRLLDLAEEVERADPNGLADQSFDAVIADTADRMKTGRQLKGVTSGLDGLDRKLGGFAPGEFVIVGGRPSMGKTLLGLSMARSMARKGVGVAVDSIEMSAALLRQRLLSDECEAMGVPVPYSRIASGRLDGQQMDAVQKAGARLQRLPLPIIDKGNRLSDVPGHIRSARRELERSGRELQAFFIDYLGLLSPGDRYRGNRVNEVGEVSLTLKSLARREKIAVIALHQLNRGNEGRDDKRPRLSDLRDSGSLEQDADVAMFVHREHYYLSRTHGQKDAEHGEREVAELNHLEVLIEKNRQGPTGKVDLWCNPALNAVRDLQQ